MGIDYYVQFLHENGWHETISLRILRIEVDTGKQIVIITNVY